MLLSGSSDLCIHHGLHIKNTAKLSGSLLHNKFKREDRLMKNRCMNTSFPLKLSQSSN